MILDLNSLSKILDALTNYFVNIMNGNLSMFGLESGLCDIICDVL